jgi:hypothetical protein
MKKWYTLLGFLLLVAVVVICAFQGSAKVKPDRGKSIITFVSRETGTDVVLVASRDAYKSVYEVVTYKNAPGNDFGIITNDGIEDHYRRWYDNYRQRSQAWIKRNNSEATGRIHSKATGTLYNTIGLKLNC